MSDNAPIIVPAGMEIITHPDGTLEVVASTEIRSKTIAFRLTPTELVNLQPFLDTFPEGSATQAMRWLLAEPGVRALMVVRVASTRSRV